jgi:hypothetical protein
MQLSLSNFDFASQRLHFLLRWRGETLKLKGAYAFCCYCLRSHTLLWSSTTFMGSEQVKGPTAGDQKSVRCQNTVARCVCCTVYLVVELMIQHVLSCQWNQESSKFSFPCTTIWYFIDSPWCMVRYLKSRWLWLIMHLHSSNTCPHSFIPSESARACRTSMLATHWSQLMASAIVLRCMHARGSYYRCTATRS